MLNGAIAREVVHVLSLEALASRHVDAQLYLEARSTTPPFIKKTLAMSWHCGRANYASERAARETAAHPIDNVTFSPGDRQPVDGCE